MTTRQAAGQESDQPALSRLLELAPPGGRSPQKGTHAKKLGNLKRELDIILQLVAYLIY